MFTGITVIDTASGLSTIFDLLLPALLLFCGILLIKKAGNKVVKPLAHCLRQSASSCFYGCLPG